MRRILSFLALLILLRLTFAQVITINPGDVVNYNTLNTNFSWLVDNKVSFVGAWSIGNTYGNMDMTTYSGATYVSLLPSNVGNTPSTSPTWWAKLPGGGTGSTIIGGTCSSQFATGISTSGVPTCTSVTPALAGLGSVTNNAQTQASIVPNSFAGFRFGNSGSADTSATAANVVSLFSACSGTQYLGADGNCHTASGGLDAACTWATLEAGTCDSGSVTANMTWAQIEAL